MSEQMHVNAELQVHWFCPECGTGLITCFDLGDTSRVVNRPHDKERGYKPCPIEWFTITVQYPVVTVALTSS